MQQQKRCHFYNGVESGFLGRTPMRGINLYMNYIRQQMVCDKLTIIQQVEKEKKQNKHRLESCNKRGICH